MTNSVPFIAAPQKSSDDRTVPGDLSVVSQTSCE